MNQEEIKRKVIIQVHEMVEVWYRTGMPVSECKKIAIEYLTKLSKFDKELI